jgi:hypothetical protein
MKRSLEAAVIIIVSTTIIIKAKWPFSSRRF